jgi:hypothetical protein
MDIWDILWPFGTFLCSFGNFFQLWYHAPRKIWQLSIAMKSSLHIKESNFPINNFIEDCGCQ